MKARTLLIRSRLLVVAVSVCFSSPLWAYRDTPPNWSNVLDRPVMVEQRPWPGQPQPHGSYADKWKEKDKARDEKKWKDKGWDKEQRKRFESLSPEERARLKERREYFKSLPPEERERIERARDKFRNLPPERREELKQKWRDMSPEQRREYHRRMEEDDRYRDHY